ncbi:MAG: hypothetical protein L0229_05225, partial [Blastocatellia bacterium]|nr:hypothetical protein [Blastocatellia bacterium]
ATIACDTNGDGTPESVVALSGVTPVTKNLIQAVIPRVAIGNTPATATSTAFPLACCGGTGTVTVTTTFTAGDNNVFGPFTRTTTSGCTLALGNRAPVVVSASPSSGDCSTGQDLILVGSCFLTPGAVTSVFALKEGDPSVRIDAQFVIFDNNTIDAFFNFGSANVGMTFRIFAQGPGGISRNLTALQPGQTCNVLGNEQGIPVTFLCDTTSQPPDDDDLPDIPTIASCEVKRRPTGAFTLVIRGGNIDVGATVTVSGEMARKTIFKSVTDQKSTKVILKGQVCRLLPGPIVIKNTGDDGGTSQPFACNALCAAN